MNKPKVLVTRKPPGSTLERLEETCEMTLWAPDEPMPRGEMVEKIADAEGLLTMIPDRIDRELLDSAPHLRAISTMAVGVDNIDIQACTERGIPVGYTPDVVTEANAYQAFALI